MVGYTRLAPHVFAIPALLPLTSVQQVLESKGRAPLLFCGPGAYDDIGHGSIEEPEPKAKKPAGKNPNPSKKAPSKPHDLPDVAQELWSELRSFPFEGLRALTVDQHMKHYRLREGEGIVPPHVDDDFVGPLASVARYSLLVYLNDDFEGGDTIFGGAIRAPHMPCGGGLLFRHDVLHEGERVLRGVKHVLKTDIFFQ